MDIPTYLQTLQRWLDQYSNTTMVLHMRDALAAYPEETAYPIPESMLMRYTSLTTKAMALKSKFKRRIKRADEQRRRDLDRRNTEELERRRLSGYSDEWIPVQSRALSTQHTTTKYAPELRPVRNEETIRLKSPPLRKKKKEENFLLF